MLTLPTYRGEERWRPPCRLRRELARACGWYPTARSEERCWRLCHPCPPAARYFCHGAKRADSCRGQTGSLDSSRSAFCFSPPWFARRAEVWQRAAVGQSRRSDGSAALPSLVSAPLICPFFITWVMLSLTAGRRLHNSGKASPPTGQLLLLQRAFPGNRDNGNWRGPPAGIL